MTIPLDQTPPQFLTILNSRLAYEQHWHQLKATKFVSMKQFYRDSVICDRKKIILVNMTHSNQQIQPEQAVTNLGFYYIWLLYYCGRLIFLTLAISKHFLIVLISLLEHRQKACRVLKFLN